MLNSKDNIKGDVVKLEKLGIARSGLQARPQSITHLFDSRAFIRTYIAYIVPLECAICNTGCKYQGWLDPQLATVHGISFKLDTSSEVQ